ncbi:MAG: AraC family transcriptional regulator [Erysipelotrichaceae bacterium]|nr:AraC family transcriptional regulator [Erysipelotrichaceae bacterium]
MELDYDYMAVTLASLSGLPVRLYYKNIFQNLYHHSKFKPDLAIIEETNIFRNPESISYYMTDTFLFFGLFRVESDDVQFVIGPVTSVPVDRNIARSILVSIGEPVNREKELKDYFQSIPPYPLRNFLQILCTFDYFLNGNKRDVSQLIISEQPQSFDAGKTLPLAEDITESEFPHNTYDYEQEMLSLVEHGRTRELETFFSQPPSGRAGTIAQDSLRQQKNLMVCSTTLVSRAAIRGGLDRETAYTLSDVYIQQSELLTDPFAVTRLMLKMALDFTRRVENATMGDRSHRIIRQIREYCLQHLSEKITVDQLANHVGLNRSYLISLFREYTGIGPGAYITKLRTDEARRLLTVSNNSLSSIATALGFCSQSHFQSVFKKETGETPLQYRNNHSV